MSSEDRQALSAHYDVLIIGAGMGGSAAAFALKECGLSVLVIERGPLFKQEADNWDPEEVIAKRKYDPPEKWLDENDVPFTPRTYYTTGGSSKFFGGSSFRFRDRDFQSRSYPDGKTRAWPLSYEDFAPFYERAEKAMWVHGLAGADPTEPPRGKYPFPPLEHEPDIKWLCRRLAEEGLSPFPLPIAVHQGPGGRCRKGSPCDGFPCKIRAKGDGENAFLRPALRQQAVTLVTGARVDRLLHDAAGQRITAAEVTLDGARHRVTAALFVLAAGAVNSAALLLRSASAAFPHGLANGSGQVGKNFMSHNNTVLLAVSPFRRNRTKFQKTFTVNDYYNERNPVASYGLGNIQMRGKVLPENLQAGTYGRLAAWFSRFVSRRSFDFWLMSEDLPSEENRVELADNAQIRLVRRLNNVEPHRKLVRQFKKMLRKVGFPFIIERKMAPSAIQHQVGTLVMGEDPATSVVDRHCKAHQLENLYVCDGSVFPSSAAVNPALTIAANALRVGTHLAERHQKPCGLSAKRSAEAKL